MVYAFLTALAFAVLMLSFYIDERKKAKEKREETDRLKKELSAAREKDLEPVYAKALDNPRIEGIMEKNGYEHRCDEDGQVWFKPDDCWYCIDTSRLPIIRLSKSFNMQEDETADWEIIPAAGRDAENKVIMSGFISEEKKFYEFYICSVENVAENFEKSLPTYLDILNATEHEFIQKYNELHDRKMLEEEKPEAQLEKMAKSIVTEQIEKAGKGNGPSKILS